jgi:hypothetical protein
MHLRPVSTGQRVEDHRSIVSKMQRASACLLKRLQVLCECMLSLHLILRLLLPASPHPTAPVRSSDVHSAVTCAIECRISSVAGLGCRAPPPKFQVPWQRAQSAKRRLIGFSTQVRAGHPRVLSAVTFTPSKEVRSG